MYSSMRLTPSTILGKEELRKIKTILQCIIDRKDAYDFLTPVDWKGISPIIAALGLTDYTFIIKNPMDLGTINNKLKEDKYRYVEEALDDIQLVWDNCKLYNQPETVRLVIFSGFIRLLRVWKDPLRKWSKTICQAYQLLSPGVIFNLFRAERDWQKLRKETRSN